MSEPYSSYAFSTLIAARIREGADPLRDEDLILAYASDRLEATGILKYITQHATTFASWTGTTTWRFSVLNVRMQIQITREGNISLSWKGGRWGSTEMRVELIPTTSPTMEEQFLRHTAFACDPDGVTDLRATPPA